MKATILLLMLMIFAILVMMSGCEEYVIQNTIDTVYVDRPIQSFASLLSVKTDTIVIRDTVKVEVVIHEMDTVFQVITRDSVIIKEVEKIVNHYDTIVIHDLDTVVITLTDTVFVEKIVYDRTVLYLDTLYVTYDMWPTTSMPEEIAPLYADFNEIAFNHGKPPLSGHIIIQYVQQSELPGESWNSNSFKFANNHIIYLNVNLPTEQQRAGMYRELNHLNYGKQYSNDVNKVMSPIFDPARTITTQQLNQMFK